MAKISPDPIESYRGRIGKISYYIRESENMARKSSSNGKVSDAPAAVAQRMKFKRLIELSKGFAPAIHLGFPQRKRGLSPANVFMSLNKGICTVEEDNTVPVDYEQLLCAQGALVEPEVTATYSASASKIMFENTSMEDFGYCNADDKTYAVLFNTQRSVCRIIPLRERGESGSTSASLPAKWEKDDLKVYVFATSANGKQASPSVYITLTEED